METQPKLTLLALGLLTLLAFGLRAYQLDGVGLAEDEVQKVVAARGYLAGDIHRNLEHPMLLKTAVAASLWVADRTGVPEETAVRFPNALVGALTTIAVFLIGQALFGRGAGLAAAAVWAVTAEAIAINRIAKEDTFLVFFCWLAYWAYVRAKRVAAAGLPSAAAYGLSGACFGLMLASKYFPNYLGILFFVYLIYGAVSGARPDNPRMAGPDYRAFFGLLAAAFLLANPVVLSPRTWQYFVSYASEETVRHTGYEVMGRLYRNTFSGFRDGLPVWLYALMLAVKTQLPVLALAAAGFVLLAKRWRELGPLLVLTAFVLWIVPFSLMPGKFFRYTLSAVPMLALAAGVACAWIYAVTGRRALVAAGLTALAVAAPAVELARSLPVPSLYVNSLAGGRAGTLFPHDEVYDAGLREAIRVVCDTAPEGAAVLGDAPPVLRYYFERYGRSDLRVVPSFDPGARATVRGPAYVVVQAGRRYFENAAFHDAAAASGRLVDEVRVGGAVSARVFFVDDVSSLAPAS
jgi:hypothetical protein